jgi:CHAT domain-containing protein
LEISGNLFPDEEGVITWQIKNRRATQTPRKSQSSLLKRSVYRSKRRSQRKTNLLDFMEKVSRQLYGWLAFFAFFGLTLSIILTAFNIDPIFVKD